MQQNPISQFTETVTKNRKALTMFVKGPKDADFVKVSEIVYTRDAFQDGADEGVVYQW